MTLLLSILAILPILTRFFTLPSSDISPMLTVAALYLVGNIALIALCLWLHVWLYIPGQCDCLDCILPMIASLALHTWSVGLPCLWLHDCIYTWSVGLPCQDASAAHDAPSPRDTGLDLPLIPPRLIQTALSWSGLLCPSWKPRDKSTNSRWRWSNRFCPGLLLSGAWRESHLRQFCQHQSPYTVPRRTPSSLPGHSLESASPPQPRGVQIPQHWNFQDATKNCGCTSPGSPKTPWVESHTSKMTLRIAFEFLPF